MKCFICNREMQKYFSKNWQGKASGSFVRCPGCGMVVNQTMYEMDDREWKKVNVQDHVIYQGTDENITDPRWVERLEAQARLFADLFALKVFPAGMKLVDYGCGDGKLSRYFKKKCNTGDEILCYDKYMADEGYLSPGDMKPGVFDGLITCSVFEHLLGKQDVEEILSYIKDDGVFCLHTLICEEVPQDPDWFYLLPTHCTLWTNKAMGILFKENGFRGCAYHVEGKMWFFFKDKVQFDLLKKKARQVEGNFVFRDGFVDYWKGKPYRS